MQLRFADDSSESGNICFQQLEPSYLDTKTIYTDKRLYKVLDYAAVCRDGCAVLLPCKSHASGLND